MADKSLLVASSETVRARMSRQPRRDTAPEVALRRELHARGRRFRLAVRVPSAPRRTIDIAFVGSKLAVFVDGCFWHACPQHATWPAANSDWWAVKLARNVQRDRDTDTLLRGSGWQVVRVWEHEPVSAAADKIEALLPRRRA